MLDQIRTKSEQITKTVRKTFYTSKKCIINQKKKNGTRTPSAHKVRWKT